MWIFSSSYFLFLVVSGPCGNYEYDLRIQNICSSESIQLQLAIIQPVGDLTMSPAGTSKTGDSWGFVRWKATYTMNTLIKMATIRGRKCIRIASPGRAAFGKTGIRKMKAVVKLTFSKGLLSGATH